MFDKGTKAMFASQSQTSNSTKQQMGEGVLLPKTLSQPLECY